MKRSNSFLSIFVLFFICLEIIFTPLDINADIINNDNIEGTIDVMMHKNLEIMSPYIDAFTRKYPNITVNYTCLSDYENSITKEIENGNIPDVFLIPAYISYDKYESELVPLGTSEELAKKYNYIEKSKVKDDLVYGLPMYACTYGIVYNKRVFDQAGISDLPKTIDEFKYDCNLILQHTSATPLYTNYNDSWAVEYWELFPFIEMNGRSDYKFNEYIYNKEPFSKDSSHYNVYKLLYDLVKNGYTEKIGTGNYNDAMVDLANGKIGSMVIGSWAYQEIQNAAPNIADIGFMPFPNNIGGHQYVTAQLDYSYGVSSKSKNIEAAKAFVQFMLDESGFALDTGNISICKTDPYTDYLNELNQVSIMIEAEATESDKWLLASLQKNIIPGSSDEIRRIMDAAFGNSSESFDSIMADWNTRWENARPEFYKVKDSSYEDGEILIQNDKVYISSQEQEYINSHPILKVGYLKYFAPFSYEIDGEPTGLAFDTCDEIKAKLGFDIEYISYDTPQDAIKALNNNEISFIAGLLNTDNSDLTYSKAYYEVLNVYVCSENTDITNLNLHKGIISPLEINSKLLNANNYTETTNVINCIGELNSSSADYTILNYYTADYYLKDFECHNLAIVPSSIYSSISIAFNKNTDSSLIALINKCIYTISNEKLQVKLLDYSTPPEKPLTLKRLIRQDPTFFIGLIALISSIIIIAITILLIYRGQNNKYLSFEMKKYKLLGALADEYMFDYDYRKKGYNFDNKFKMTFGFDSVYQAGDSNLDDKYSQFIDKIQKIENDDNEQNIAFQLTSIDGITNWYKMFLSPINDNNGNHIYIVGKLVNVQKEVEEKELFQAEAELDGLTKILNRRGFEKKLPEFASNILYIVSDMDNFKGVNDTLGHLGGDMVLCTMADALTNILGDSAIVARYGGDEFVAIIPNISLSEAHERLQKLVEFMDRTVEFEGIKHHISISAGGLYSFNEVKINDLFTKADEILYEKKKNGKNGYFIKEL